LKIKSREHRSNEQEYREVIRGRSKKQEKGAEVRSRSKEHK